MSIDDNSSILFDISNSPELIFKPVNLRSTQIFLTEEEVVFVWTELSPVGLDFPHGNEVVGSGRQGARVDEQGASVVFSPGNSVSQHNL